MRRKWLSRFAILSLATIAMMSAAASTDDKKDNKQVKLYTDTVEVVEIQPSAEKCPKGKGTTIRLKVKSDAPVDVRLYSPATFGSWINKDFANQQKGDEITNYMCGNANAVFKVYARSAGSSEIWPRP